MKKTLGTLIISLSLIVGSSAFILKTSTGIQGYAGSPGEATCSTCHSGGSSASSGITITAIPDFSLNGNSELEFMPDSVYEIKVELGASGFAHYGFASQILNASNTNAGVLQNAGPGVKFLNAGAKRTAVQTTPKTTATTCTFTYKWKAPSQGEATIYAIGNAVDGGGGTGGDFVISPVSIALVAAPTPTIDVVGLKENGINVSQVSVFPSPASDFTNISYHLKQSKTITVELLDIKGNVVRQLYDHAEIPGYHSHILSLNGISSGIYFIKTSADQQKVSQKLITVL